MNRNDFNLTPEQKEVLTDLVEFYNNHAVETVSFGHSRRFGELGAWSWSYVQFLLKSNRVVLFRFKRTLVTPDFEEVFCYLIHQDITTLFPSEGGSQNTFAWERWKYDYEMIR